MVITGKTQKMLDISLVGKISIDFYNVAWLSANSIILVQLYHNTITVYWN